MVHKTKETILNVSLNFTATDHCVDTEITDKQSQVHFECNKEIKLLIFMNRIHPTERQSENVSSTNFYQ